MLHRKSQTVGPAAHALLVKNQRCCGGVISRHCAPASLAAKEPKSPVVITMMPPGLRCREQRKRLLRVGQMLDNIEEDDNIQMTELPQGRFVRHAAVTFKPERRPCAAAVFGRLDAGHVEMRARPHQEKAVGATDLEQAALSR